MQIPSEHRTQLNDLTPGTSVLFSLEDGDSETMLVDGQKAASLSGADRCILLCRFLL